MTEREAIAELAGIVKELCSKQPSINRLDPVAMSDRTREWQERADRATAIETEFSYPAKFFRVDPTDA